MIESEKKAGTCRQEVTDRSIGPVEAFSVVDSTPRVALSGAADDPLNRGTPPVLGGAALFFCAHDRRSWTMLGLALLSAGAMSMGVLHSSAGVGSGDSGVFRAETSMGTAS